MEPYMNRRTLLLAATAAIVAIASACSDATGPTTPSARLNPSIRADCTTTNGSQTC